VRFSIGLVEGKGDSIAREAEKDIEGSNAVVDPHSGWIDFVRDESRSPAAAKAEVMECRDDLVAMD
jgi:hypothetical protein